MIVTRRQLILATAAFGAAGNRAFAQPVTRNLDPVRYAEVVPGYALRFPYDSGAHPEFRIEWWYVTGWLDAASAPLGFQITFFRVKPALKERNPSAFTPQQIMIGHVALADPKDRRLVHAQRAARTSFDLAGAEVGRTRVWIDDWLLENAGDKLVAHIRAREFQLALTMTSTQPALLQGDNGFSRKGPQSRHASYYYSMPQLAVAGSIEREGRRRAVAGSAWLDHEWSSSYMAREAVGWDWIGINFEDGRALMAFRMRNARGEQIWAGATLRRADAGTRVFQSAEIRFSALRQWRSARTGTTYPIAWKVVLGELEISIEPLFDDQEHDTRATTGTIYWEGAVRARIGGTGAGRGYLELTGYSGRPDV